jgi:hypothetical protein
MEADVEIVGCGQVQVLACFVSLIDPRAQRLGERGPRREKALDPVKNQGLSILVAWGGIEPPTRGFSIRCSTN